MHRFLLTLALLPLVALAQPGTLDPLFGDGGTVFLTPDPVAGTGAVGLTADGKIVLAGIVGGDAAVLRLSPDGSLDTDFGNDGYALVDLGGGEDQFLGLIVRADGSLVASGLGTNSQGDGVNVLAAFSAEGVLDPSFGNGGTVTLNEGFESLQFTRLAERPGGSLLVTGAGIPPDADDSVAIVAQLSADGALDGAFGTDGIARIALAGRGVVGQDLAVQADGRIVVGGLASGALFDIEPFAARLTETGSLDESFGVRTFDFGASFSLVSGVLVDEAGRAVLVGLAADLLAGSSSLVLARLAAADGSLDTSFGEGGLVVTTLGTEIAQGTDVLEQSDGKLLAAGPAGPNGSEADFAVARFTSDGSLDDSFGNGGVGMADIGVLDIPAALALQADGNVVVAGYASTAGGTPVGIEVARFENDGRPSAVEPLPSASAIRLGAPYPNPTAGAAWLPVEAPPGVAVRVEVFDRLGRRVAVLHDGPATGALLRLDLSELASGAYAVRAVSGGSTVARWLIRP